MNYFAVYVLGSCKPTFILVVDCDSGKTLDDAVCRHLCWCFGWGLLVFWGRTEGL